MSEFVNPNDVASTDEQGGIGLFNLLTSDPVDDAGALAYEEIEAELKAFEEAERAKLGLEEEQVEHWYDDNPQRFTEAQRSKTTILAGGLTQAQDMIICAGLSGLGYNMEPLPVPDYESLRYGKEFGNRGQCNPTYFTVGNLVRHLVRLRDEKGMSAQEIVDGYIFVTAGACGPCRFGTYVTEYRKALRDAGFEGFRVMLFQQQGGLKQATGEGGGLDMNPTFFITLLQAIMCGDVLNAVCYRIRPYEVNEGETDRVMHECRQILVDAFQNRKSSIAALVRCRRKLNKIPVNRLQPKPKVSIIGEFWAMTTEGDGNYKLQNFLESEGAEVDVQLVSAWILYNIWQHRWDTKRRMTMRRDDEARTGLAGKNPAKTLATLAVAEQVLKGAFQTYANAVGLHGYHLPDMEEIATISHPYYDNHLRGGEGHMEVGKLIQTAEKKKAHMVISVKPFGCMPSSGVSDGVQSLITAKYPEAIFTAIETTGDGAVNVQSRIQMDLFKARQKAVAEFDETLASAGKSREQIERKARWRFKHKALHYPRHQVAGTGANQILELSR